MDNDARLNGRVSWEFYSTGETSDTDATISEINTFLNMNTNETDFSGDFVFISFWEEMHPYPAGASAGQAGPYLMHVSSFKPLQGWHKENKSGGAVLSKRRLISVMPAQ